jgi:hypothetical protein
MATQRATVGHALRVAIASFRTESAAPAYKVNSPLVLRVITCDLVACVPRVQGVSGTSKEARCASSHQRVRRCQPHVAKDE